MFIETVIATALVTSLALTVYGIASFGEGMMFQVLLQVCNRLDSTVCDGDLATSTLTLSLSAIFTNPIQLWILRDFVDIELGKNLAFFQAIGVIIGVRLLFMNQSLLLPHLLGLLLFLIMLQKVAADVSVFAAGELISQVPIKKYKFLKYKNYLIVWCTGLISGLLSGIYLYTLCNISIFTALFRDVWHCRTTNDYIFLIRKFRKGYNKRNSFLL